MQNIFVIFDVQNTIYSDRKGIFDDVKDVLNILKSNNVHLGIISNLSKHDLEEILETFSLSSYFDVVISSYEYDTLKPDPKLINIAITLLEDKKKIKIDKDNTYYVGDRPDVDVRMANLAGIKSVRIIRGKYALKEPEDDYEVADYTIKSLNELLDILNINVVSPKSDEVEVL